MSKITAYGTLATPLGNDVLPVVDVNDATMASSGTTKKTLVSNFSPGLQLIYVDQLSGIDPTGSADCSTAVRAKQTALGTTTAYALVFGAGTYKMSSAFVNLGLNQYVWGQGQFLTSFTWSGSGPLITQVEPGTFNASHRAGRCAGFSINGPFGSGGTAGIKYGGLQSIQLDDVGFFGLDAGAVIGYKFGASDWAEEAVMTRITAVQCGDTSGYTFGFSGTSFDYSKIDAVVVGDPGVDIISLSTGAQLQGLDLALRGNVHGGTSNTGAIISIDRGNTSGTSYLRGAKFAVSMENDAGTGTVGHYLLWMGSSNSSSQFSADGVFELLAAGATPQGTNNPNFLPASFNGITLDPSGGAMTSGDATAIMGGELHTPFNAQISGAQFGAPFAGNIYPQFGKYIGILMSNGANTAFVFNGLNGFIREFDILLQQPSSGAAGTATWPASVTWGAAGAPTLSTANGVVDWVKFVQLPTVNKYLGVLVAKGFAI